MIKTSNFWHLNSVYCQCDFFFFYMTERAYDIYKLSTENNKKWKWGKLPRCFLVEILEKISVHAFSVIHITEWIVFTHKNKPQQNSRTRCSLKFIPECWRKCEMYLCLKLHTFPPIGHVLSGFEKPQNLSLELFSQRNFSCNACSPQSFTVYTAWFSRLKVRLWLWEKW